MYGENIYRDEISRIKVEIDTYLDTKIISMIRMLHTMQYTIQGKETSFL